MAHPLLRASAVVFSAALLIGFVVFRARGCKANAPASDPVPTLRPATMRFEVMHGSKSGRMVPVDTSKEFRTMGGSKSLVITEGSSFGSIASPAATQPATAPATTPAEPPR